MYKIYQVILLLTLLVLSAQISKRPSTAVVPQIQKVYDKAWYSGYFDINDTGVKNVVHHMHYFFFPTQNNYSTDPVLFWFNGGPGCSSLLGALYENGPFLINDAFGMIMNNKFSWNKNASVVYIQSPSEVGFSYMQNKPEGHTWTDDQVAVLNRQAVLEFYRVWNQFSGRPTFLAGESYGGIYVPTLFEKLHDFNINAPPSQKVNIQGFGVGNGCTHESECQFLSEYSSYLMQLYRDYGFITSQLFEQLEDKCANKGQDLPHDCQTLYIQTLDMQEGMNIYDAFRPCYQNQVNQTQPSKSFRQLKRLSFRKRTKNSNGLSQTPPCVDSAGINKFLNSKQNRQKLGIPTTVPDYSMCVDGDFQYNRSLNGSYHIYKRLIPLNQYRILKYSGDSDPAVPTSGTLFWVNKIRDELKLPSSQYWKPWYTRTDNGIQNSGNVWELTNNFKLVTFKGIGHMAPQWNSEGGQKVIYNLIFGTQL